MDREQMICPCLDVTAGQIMDAYEEGATTVDAIKDITGAGSVCGACIDQIEDLLIELKG
ncbi:MULTISPECIES: (2Fe-2S)-binding protein [Anaerostipes]|uniref:(2Fe-2S)-binding protein n=1 Tax=Anaerostipes TaxID=207244 RepID=UPI0009515AEB|nr:MULTISPECIES: (2Fe-2S)-binding protein [Anaerostipes]MCI5622988.1 (2Fe-2S)-binding protein [Anaerostipes sp.]MDY2726785.1 (2Fe-2S)-binding protein [Anaerostipes faecalis]OLR58253.1 (2Fe-2S)-binding protein [Anaerostipes sp. 494a]